MLRRSSGCVTRKYLTRLSITTEASDQRSNSQTRRLTAIHYSLCVTNIFKSLLPPVAHIVYIAKEVQSKVKLRLQLYIAVYSDGHIGCYFF